MKYIHIADVHANRERYPLIEAAFSKICDYCMEHKITAVFIAGDFWDSSITNTSASHFTDYVDLVKKLSEVTTVVMMYGTASHEPAGSLDIFDLIPDVIVYKGYSPMVVKLEIADVPHEFIFIPEPRLSLIEGNTLEDKYDKIQESYKAVKKQLKKKEWPRICLFHGEVAGMKFQNGTIIQKTGAAITKEMLKSYDADYYALGHIHMPQELEGMNGGYAGSLVPKDFGENHEACFWEFEI